MYDEMAIDDAANVVRTIGDERYDDPVRYESSLAGNEPVLYLPLPGVREDVVMGVPPDAPLAWPGELRISPR